MPQPTPYTPAYDFTNFQSVNPADPLPADKVDIELAAIETTTDEILVNLALIQRDDGAIANGVVTPDSLSTAALALIGGGWTPQGAWVTATVYAVSDVVTQGGVTYVCVTAHTAGTFSTDLAAVKWISISSTATNTTYDNSTSGLAATTVQAAIDEIQGDAAKTDYDNTISGLAATNVKTAIDEVDAKADTNATNVAALLSGLSWKGEVLVATTANITLSGEQTLDGVLTSTSRVLVKNQSAPAENGIYVSAAGAWARASDMTAWASVPGATVAVQQGSANADTIWLCTSDSGGTLETTSITFTQQGIGDINAAGTGLTKTAQTLSVDFSVVSAVTRTVNAQTGTSYTLVAGDAGDVVTMSNASANTLTIPTNASVAFATGTQIDVTMLGAGTTSIAGATGVTVNGVSAGSGDINAQYASVTLLKLGTDTWLVTGAIGTVA